jgi:hypothetical protein
VTSRRDEIAEARARAILGAAEISEAQLRAACLLLAGKALDAADGDWDTAKAILHGPLEAIGAFPYEEFPRNIWGNPQKEVRAREQS